MILQDGGKRPLFVIKEIRELLCVDARTAQRLLEEVLTRLGPTVARERAEFTVFRMRHAGASADVSDEGDGEEVTRG